MKYIFVNKAFFERCESISFFKRNFEMLCLKSYITSWNAAFILLIWHFQNALLNIYFFFVVGWFLVVLLHPHCEKNFSKKETETCMFPLLSVWWNEIPAAACSSTNIWTFSVSQRWSVTSTSRGRMRVQMISPTDPQKSAPTLSSIRSRKIKSGGERKPH